MLSLFDTHCHLDQSEFAADRAEVIRRATQAGVERILTVGITADTSAAAVQLAGEFPTIYAAVGLQPNYCGSAQPADWDRVRELTSAPRVVALGETGLDRYWNYTPFAVQQDYFDRHLRLMQECGLPVVIHSRDCDADIVAMLRAAAQRGPVCGVMHSFTGSRDTAWECLELGLYISLAGMVTYKKSSALRELAAALPAERLLIETDSPYLSPHPLRGKRNEPAHLVHTAACVAEARGTSLDELARLTMRNACRLFRLPEPGSADP